MKKEHTGGLTPMGDLMKSDLRFKPPTKTQWGLIEAAAEIGMGKKGLPTYQHTVLCQTSLPYRRTAERVRERLNGAAGSQVNLALCSGRYSSPR